MDSIKIIETASKIQHLTDLNTYVINQNGELIFHNEVITVPSFMPGADNGDIFDLYSEMKQKNNQLYLYPNSWGLFYMGYHFSIEEDFSIIIGPYLELTLNSLHLTNKHQLSYNESEDLAIFSNQIHILNAEKVQSYASILPLFEEIAAHKITPIHVQPTDLHLENRQSTHTHRSNVNTNHLVNQRYKVETDLLHAVEQGNKAEAIRLLDADNALFTFSERFPRQPIRRIKNLAIVLNTLLRTTAKRNQVPPILIHRISEKFAIDIENKSQLVELAKLQKEMITAYTDLIVETSLAQYSKITQTVISYIMTYYDQKIDIKDLADICFTHSSHLSRKFKQETNMTITAYQQNIRLRQAKHLLLNEIIPIEEIAWMVGYEDPSYFSRVFKQDTGYTPSQYREQ